MLDDVERGVERAELFRSRVQFLAANVPGGVDDLSLQVASVNDVEVDKAKCADASRS